MLYSTDEVKSNISKLLIFNGVCKEDATLTANILLEADLRGYKSHGVERIFQILDGFQHKSLLPVNHSMLIKDNKSVTIVDGKNYLGQPLAHRLMSIAINRSKIYGVGVSGVVNSGHIGLLSYYSELAAQQGCVGLVMTTSSPAVVLKGSGRKFFGTNPISYSIPTKNSPPIIADFSTSKVSRSKIFEYLKAGRSLPEDWAVRADGKPTTSAQDALDGGIQTFDAGIKGASLSLLISILSGPLIGGVINSEVKGTRYMNESSNKGDFFISFDISHFTNLDQFKEIIENLISSIKQEKSDFRVPGSRAHEQKKFALLNGLEISPELNALFTQLQEDLHHAV